MRRRVIRWLCRVLPPWWTLAMFGGFYLFVAGIEAWTNWLFGSLYALNPQPNKFAEVRCILVGWACCSYGIFRLVAFHPRFRPEYFRWLSATPWTVAKPLPQGPVHVVLQDLVLLAVLAWLVANRPGGPATVLNAALVSYLFMVALVTRVTGLLWIPYGILFGIGLAVWLGLDTWVGFGWAASLYGLAYAGLRTSLSRFPWPDPSYWMDWAKQAKTRPADQPGDELGWPFDRLQPRGLPPQPARVERVLLSLLAGWLVYAAVSRVSEHEGRMALLVLAHGGCLVACVGGRVLTYCQYRWPPLSLAGRIFTLRWIIPGYDRVFVAPLCTLLIGGAGTAEAIMLRIAPHVVLPASISLMLLVTLLLGPKLETWQMTGSFRLVPGLGAGKRTQFVQL